MGPLGQVTVERADREQHRVDLPAGPPVGGDRQPFPPRGRGRRGQPQVGLLGVELQHLPPEQPHQPVGQPDQRGVVHPRLDLAEVVHEQVPHPRGWNAVAVDQRGDRVLAGVAGGRPRRPQRRRLPDEHPERDQQLPSQVLPAVPAGGADHVGVVQQLLPAQLLETAAGADQHPGQAVLGIDLLPGQGVAVRGQRPQPRQPVRFADLQEPGQRPPWWAGAQQPGVRRPQHPGLYQLVEPADHVVPLVTPPRGVRSRLCLTVRPGAVGDGGGRPPAWGRVRAAGQRPPRRPGQPQRPRQALDHRGGRVVDAEVPHEVAGRVGGQRRRREPGVVGDQRPHRPARPVPLIRPNHGSHRRRGQRPRRGQQLDLRTARPPGRRRGPPRRRHLPRHLPRHLARRLARHCVGPCAGRPTAGYPTIHRPLAEHPLVDHGCSPSSSWTAAAS